MVYKTIRSVPLLSWKKIKLSLDRSEKGGDAGSIPAPHMYTFG